MKEIHKKAWPEYYKAVQEGIKLFELRKDEDNVEAGDILILEEWWNGDFTGYSLKRKVIYVLRDIPQLGLNDGYCIIGLDPTDPDKYEEEPRTVEDVIERLEGLEMQNATVVNNKDKPIKIYAGRENKKNGKPIVMIC